MSLVWVEFRNGLPYRIYHNAKQAAIAEVSGLALVTMEYGEAIGSIREQMYLRDRGECQECGKHLPLNGSLYQRAHMAHITGKGRGGEDCLDNVRTLCYEDHIEVEHKGGKVVPRK